MQIFICYQIIYTKIVMFEPAITSIPQGAKSAN